MDTEEIHKYKATRQVIRKHCDAYVFVFSKDTCIYAQEII